MGVSLVLEGAIVAVVTFAYVCNTRSRVFDLLRLCNWFICFDRTSTSAMSADRGKSTAAATRKQKVIWSPNAEAKLIGLLADVLGKYDGKMMTKNPRRRLSPSS